jgi:cob(I)alamin adenosyltransferase
MKIYTKTGDKGKTSLFGGTRVYKSHLRIEAYGTIDELNANIGLLKDHVANEFVSEILYKVQERLFVLGAILATDPAKAGVELPAFKKEDIRDLEIEIDKMEENLSPLRNFIIPGGHPVVSLAHIARTVCRRAERSMVLLSENAPVDGILLEYVNRLSDFLFVMGRFLAKELNVNEITWKSGG